IGIGALVLVAFISILKSENELLRGSLIPLGLLLVVLVGYGGYILYSRPAHAKESIALYQKSPEEAVVQETAKHINDNKAGKTLIRFFYPGIILISALVLLLVSSPFCKGMALGFILLAASAYVIDSGFVSRSDAFIAFLETIK
ncbi:MAG: hypothetical protein ACPGD8_08450, partial [Flavobacteriales bacterium]